MVDKARLYELLEHQRQIVTTPDMGEQRKADAWCVVNLLLDNLIELNALDVEYDPEPPVLPTAA